MSCLLLEFHDAIGNRMESPAKRSINTQVARIPDRWTLSAKKYTTRLMRF